MAIGATAKWEVRADGSATNGGFYTSGGTDYSQQATAQLALTDIATDGAGTGVSSATGGFTAAMVGNGIYLTGGGSSTGWYEITGYTNTNNITIDRSAGISASSVTGNVGGAIFFADAPLEAVSAGNTVWIKAGNYTLTAIVGIASGVGTEALSVNYRGYNATRGDNPTGDNRPNFIGGSSYVALGSYTNIFNCRGTGSGVLGIRVGYAGKAENCKFQNDSATANRQALGTNGNGGTFVDCEAISDAGYGMVAAHSGVKIIGCSVHDCGAIGISNIGSYCMFDSNIIDTCVIGFQASGSGHLIKNNVLYGNTTYGINIGATDNNFILNNAIVSNGVGITATDGHQGENDEDYNNFYGNTTDRENINVGPNSIALDPQFTNAAAGDFSIAAGSNMADKAFTIRLGVGA